jgi:predicted MPP superfamily phosphohydrolase
LVTKYKAIRITFWIAVLILAADALFVEPSRLVVRTAVLPLERWPADYPQLRVVLISDLHAGAPHTDLDKVARVVAAANALHPDLTLLLGDYVITGIPGGHLVPPEQTVPLLGRLRARLGVVAVMGNHDVGFSARRTRAAFRAAGIPLLENATLTVDVAPGKPLLLAGLEDLWTQRPNLAIVNGAASTPTILMTHSPDIFPRVPSSVALTVAGHTHGGQVWLPLVGRLVVPSRFGQRYAYGHVVEGGRHLFVTSGIGMSIMPVRFCDPPEIRLLEIRSAPTAPRPLPANATRSTP